MIQFFCFFPIFSQWVLKVFYWLIFCLVFYFNFLSLCWEVFHQQHDFLKLINFLIGLRCSHWSLSFTPQSSIIRLGGFLPCSYSNSSSMIPHLAKLVSEKKSNCNNRTFRAESYQNRYYIMTIIQIFSLVSMTFIATLYPVWLLFRALGYFSTYKLDFFLPYILDSLLFIPQDWQGVYIQVGKTF